MPLGSIVASTVLSRDCSLQPHPDERTNVVEGDAASVRLWAVVVLYLPVMADLKVLLDELERQAVPMVAIANSDITEPIRAAVERIGTLELNPENNISSAFNRGVALAQRHGATHVLLLDQDSDVGTHDYLARTVRRLGHHPTSFRPRIVGTSGLVEPMHLPAMTSGLVLGVGDFIATGGYNTRLPLDLADVDFCLRWKSHFHVAIPTDLTLTHQHDAGLPAQRRLFGRTVRFSARSERRYASIAYGRALSLSRWAKTDRAWASHEIKTAIKQFPLALIVGGPREFGRYVRGTVRGLVRAFRTPMN